jgi:rhamnogalacturonyl hydrolase YesR
MTRYPNPDTLPYKSWSYSQGYILYGFEKLWKSTGNQTYFNYLTSYVEQHVDRNGNLREFSGDSMDDMLSGITILAVYEATGLEKYKLAAQHIRKAFNTYPRNADGGFWHAKSLHDEMWIDGIFMGQMFLIRYAKSIGDATYCFDEAARQLSVYSNRAAKPNGLLVHAYHEKKKASWADKTTGLSSEVWAEGLGWYAIVLVETLERMPTSHPQRTQLLTIFNNLYTGLKHAQDSLTGLWYNIVDKGTVVGNWHDTSGSAMFVYTIQKAIELGLVDTITYAPVAQKGYVGITSKAVVTRAGLVDIYDACDGVCVQNSYHDYVNYPKSVNAKECVGGFLLATGIVENSHGDTCQVETQL